MLENTLWTSIKKHNIKFYKVNYFYRIFVVLNKDLINIFCRVIMCVMITLVILKVNMCPA